MGSDTPSVVGLVRGDDRYENVASVLAAIGDTVKLEQARRILVKPNFVSASRQLAATHVDAVRAVLDFLRQRNAGHIVIAERAALGSASDAFRRFGYRSLLDRYDVELVDLERDGWVEGTVCDANLRPQKVRLARRVVESDFRISVARLKTHDCVIATLSLKNMAIGALRDRTSFHHGPRAENLSLYNLAALTAPHLAVLDGFEGMEGNGPVSGQAVDLRLAIASSDFVAADATAARVMGLDPHCIGYLVYCQRGGWGEMDPARLELRGNVALAAARKPFRRHPAYEQQLGWPTPAAERMVEPGARRGLLWEAR